ncbi:MAG: CRISPR-associated RAMP protein Csx7 [Aigarchaeota archaeon]|nr:CRISPR-associated RAMP protein Csx7 [Aigarchaeota archaeon]
MAEIPWTSGRILMREITLSGYLENVEPLRIGVGGQQLLTSIVDLAVIKVHLKGFEVPYIPGSSLKGSFRSTAMALVQVKGLTACSGLAKDTCVDKEIEHGVKLRDMIEQLIRTGDSAEAMRKFFENSCILCKIFGAPGYMSRIVFGDAYPMDNVGNLLNFRISKRTGIAINRRTGAVFGGALYDVEFVEPGTRFRFEIRCRNLPNYAIGLLSAVTRLLHEGGVKVGGFKTRGFGRVKVIDPEMKIIDFGESKNLRLRPLEAGVDMEVDVSDIVRIEDGLLIAEGEKAWQLLDRFEKVWWNAKIRGQGS